MFIFVKLWELKELAHEKKADDLAKKAYEEAIKYHKLAITTLSHSA